MRRTRIAQVLLGAACLAVLVQGPAAAGGGSWFEFDDDVLHDDYLAVGETA